MSTNKPMITLVGLRQAKLGFSFLNNQPLKECENCSLFKVCGSKLEIGRIYVITAVRDKVFPCKVHEEGVRVVIVIEQNVKTNIDKRLAFLSGIITFAPQTCEEISCSNYEKCVPLGLKTGDKCKILEINRQDVVICPQNRLLVSSVLERVMG